MNFDNALSDFHLQSDVYRDQSVFKVAYQLNDLKNLLVLPEPFTKDGHQATRLDGLWNNTCFEMFLRPKGQTSYYEFNFSLTPAWNQYFFDSYRNPQPPKPSTDFTLKKMQWDGHNLEIELTTDLNLTAVEISLAVVLKEKSEKIHYLALKHAGQEPDFHHSQSFALTR